MKAPSRSKVLQAANVFMGPTVVFMAVLIVIHSVPKGFTPRSSFRLVCMLAFFITTISLTWQLITPRSHFAHLLYRWRFEGCPQAIERIWRRYLYSVDRLFRALGYAGIVFLASNAILMLALWFHGFNLLAGLARWGWWGSLGTLLLLPFVRGDLITEVVQRRRQLHEQLELTTWFRPRSMRSLYRGESSEVSQRPVEVIAPMSFRAGGVDWHWDDFKPNCIIFGQSGSGKTISVLNALVDGLLASATNAGERPSALILDPKGDFRGKIEALCEEYGRAEDLLIIRPADLTHSIRWNPFDTDDDELEIAARFAATLEVLGMKQQDSTYFIDAAKKFIRHAITLLRLTNAPGEPPSFGQIGELATSFDAIVERTNMLNVEDSSCDKCLNYFANEWIEYGDEHRTSILGFITNMLDPFTMEPYSSVFSGKSTMRIGQMLQQGKILYLDMPVADREAMAKTIGTFIKLEYFREVLKARKKDRPSFFLCDEFQVFLTTGQGKGDADFFERSRESNHINLIATQNLPALLKNTQRTEPVHNLLGNCAVKLFLRNTDTETNEYASKIFGQRLVSMSASAAGMGNASIGGFGIKGIGESISTHDGETRVVPTETFAELAIPSQAAGIDYCESVLFHGARAEFESHLHKTRWKIHPI